MACGGRCEICRRPLDENRKSVQTPICISEAPIPSGADSHNRLLEDFLSQPELGGKLSADIQHRLKKYKNFRHRFIHGYGFEVEWEKVDEPLRLLPETVKLLSSVWLGWLDGVRN